MLAVEYKKIVERLLLPKTGGNEDNKEELPVLCQHSTNATTTTQLDLDQFVADGESDLASLRDCLFKHASAIYRLTHRPPPLLTAHDEYVFSVMRKNLLNWLIYKNSMANGWTYRRQNA